MAGDPCRGFPLMLSKYQGLGRQSPPPGLRLDDRVRNLRGVLLLGDQPAQNASIRR
jgi:hypothetical protein